MALTPLLSRLVSVVVSTVAATIVAPQVIKVLEVLIPNLPSGMIVEPWAFSEPVFWTSVVLLASDIVRQVSTRRLFTMRSTVVLVVTIAGWINRSDTFLPDYEAGIVATGCFLAIIQGLYADLRSVVQISNGTNPDSVQPRGLSLSALLFFLGCAFILAAHATTFLHYVPLSRILTRHALDIFFSHDPDSIPFPDRDRAFALFNSGYWELRRAALLNAVLLLAATLSFWFSIVTKRKGPNQSPETKPTSRPVSA